METAGESAGALPPAFRQPKPWLRWTAVALALAGWGMSLALLLVSGGLTQKAVLRLSCLGTATDSCADVLTSPQAYVPLGKQAGAPRLPVSAFGMAYFAFVALWYLFIGPPTRSRWAWHLVILFAIGIGVWQSAAYIASMAHELHRWCAGCLTVHGINGLLAVVALLSCPWRKATAPVAPHPSTRLALATVAVAVLALVLHLTTTLGVVINDSMGRQAEQCGRILNDPEFARWDFNRQPVVDIPLRPDEVFAGPEDAPHTVVVFGDFQCTVCRKLHEVLVSAAQRQPGRMRVAFRSYPQDPACNPNPRFRSGGHASACRAARAAEAARVVGGREAYLAMRAKLWDRQAQLPTTPVERQSAAERRLLADWAAEIGLDREGFVAAFDSPEVAARIREDIELAERLELTGMPVVYVNGRRLRGWSGPEIWDALLSAPPAGTTAPTSTGP